MRTALAQPLVDGNPAPNIKRHLEQKRDRLLTIEAFLAIHKHAGPRLRVIIDLLVRTGQRVGDVLEIRRTDLTDDRIRCQQQQTGAMVLVRWTAQLRETVARAKRLNGNMRALTH